MWETIKRWLRGLWVQLPVSLKVLLLYLIDIAVCVILYAGVRAGATLTRDISDILKDPAASAFFKSLEWLITIAGILAAAVFVVCTTIDFMNKLFVVFFDINFMKIIKRRLGLDGSDDQGQAQQTGPLPPQPSEQTQEQTEEQSGHREEGQSDDTLEDQAKNSSKKQSKKKPKSKRKKKSKKHPTK